MACTTEGLTLAALREAYAGGKLTPTALVAELLPKIAASHATFITKPREWDTLERCK